MKRLRAKRLAQAVSVIHAHGEAVSGVGADEHVLDVEVLIRDVFHHAVAEAVEAYLR